MFNLHFSLMFWNKSFACVLWTVIITMVNTIYISLLFVILKPEEKLTLRKNRHMKVLFVCKTLQCPHSLKWNIWFVSFRLNHINVPLAHVSYIGSDRRQSVESTSNQTSDIWWQSFQKATPLLWNALPRYLRLASDIDFDKAYNLSVYSSLYVFCSTNNLYFKVPLNIVELALYK